MERKPPVGFNYCECGKCNELIPYFDKNGRHLRFVKGHNSKGSGNSQYRGIGKPKQKYIYKEVRCHGHPNADKRGRLRRHVYNFTVRDGKLFCCMLKWGVVHHKIPVDEGGKDDLENLEGMIRGKHKSLHGEKDMSDRVCYFCKSETSHKRHWYVFNGHWICKACNDKKRWRDRLL